MKQILRISALAIWAGVALILFQSPKAQAFQINANVVVTPHYIQATLCNEGFGLPMVCHATAYGMLNTGYWINAWASLYLWPDQCDYAYVYANYPYFFTTGYGTADCQFTR